MILAVLALATAAVAPDSVRIVTEKPDCKFVEQKICSTGRSAGEAVCQKWHRVQAGRAGANTVHVLTVSQDQSGGAAGGVARVRASTSMTADYYSCE